MKTNDSDKQAGLVESSALILASMEYLLNKTNGAHRKEWEAALDALAGYLALVLCDDGMTD
jgi:hypothetical protein